YVQRRGSDRALTAADYEAVGGVAGALQQRANRVYDDLDAAHQLTMKRVLLRMVAFEGGTLARRRVPLSELAYDDDDTGAENARVAAVVDALVASRLVVRGSDESGTRFVEPAHDKLITACEKLIEWHAEAQAQTPDFVTLRKLTVAAGDWAAAPDREKGGLLWSDRAPMLGQLLRARASWLNHAEGEFARRSRQRHRFLRATQAAA